MPPERAAAAALAPLLLLSLGAVLGAPPGAGQVAPPEASGVVFEALPPEVGAAARRWLEEGNASLRAFAAAHPGANSSLLRVPLEGAWEFVDEERLTLAMAQLFKVHSEARLQGILRNHSAPEARRDAALADLRALNASGHASRDAFLASLRAAEPGLRTTHGLEMALFAARVGIIGDSFLSGIGAYENLLANATAPDENVLRAAILFSTAPGNYLAWARDLLAAAQAADGDPGRPRLDDGVARLAAATRAVFAGDPGVRSQTGPASSAALERFRAANRTGPDLWYVARFADLQQARSTDALEFLHSRRELTAQGLGARLHSAVEDPRFIAVYDGQLRETGLDPPLARVVAAGYAGVHLVDARNHARWRLGLGSEFNGLTAGWSELVGGLSVTYLLADLPGKRSQGGGADWLLLGGVAVVVALGAVAFALFRKPKS